ncbi:MAG TPA: hypothetical protein VGS57_19300 [Thermoanaerobaculia bacterium]|jgi:hypothetical protein|nr:hypothetical protein [Thermoanaerobaculia bacterium]
MRRPHVTLVPALLVLLALPAALRGEGFSIGARAGTTGIGPELAFGLGPHLDVRIPVGIGSYDDVYDKTGVRYDAKLELRNALLLADFHPGGGGFRISAGGGWDDNRLKVSAPVRELVRRYHPELVQFVPASAGSIHGEATGDSFAPYIGLGWGSATRGGRWGLSFDLGVLYQGSPQVDLTTDLNLGVTLPASVRTILDAATADEEQRLERELEDYKYYPVVALAIVFRP